MLDSSTMKKGKKVAIVAAAIALPLTLSACNPMFSQSDAWAAGAGPTKVRFCESGNNYAINTGNGYYGAWQFDYPSWHANGGGQFANYPHYASKQQQDYVAWTYWKKAGWGPWACKP